jgi:hypothetical protein
MHKITPLLLASLMTIGFVGGIFLLAPITAVHATSSNNNTPHLDGIVATTLPTSTSDDADYSNPCPGGLSGCTVPSTASTSWGETIFSVTNTGTTAITITDCCYEGDFYSLWSTTDTTGLTGWTLVGTTDQVYTGPELVAPTYDPFWTGTGSAYSSTTFNIPMSGTVLFAVRDDIFDQMVNLLGTSCGGASVVTAGCSATGISVSGGWSAAGYEISFTQGGTAGCLVSGATSWPPVTFTDGSNASVAVSGGAPAGACAAMTIEDLFTSQPSGTGTSPVSSSPNYYDLSVTGLTAGTATVCFIAIEGSPTITSATGMFYWNGNSWSPAASVTFSSSPYPKVCGQIPVTELDTLSTPVVIGTPTTVVSGVPEFGAPAMLVAAIGMLGVALVARRLRPLAIR